MALKQTDYDGLEELSNYSIKKEYFSKLKKEISAIKPSITAKPSLSTANLSATEETTEPLNISADKLLYKLNIDTDKNNSKAKDEKAVFSNIVSNSNADNKEPEKNKRSFFWLILVILLIIALIALYFLFTNNNGTSADKGGQQKQEQAYANQQDRLNKINALPIEESRRQALRSKQIFMGATFEQAKLALGSPSKVINTSNSTEWHYINSGKLETKVIFKDGRVSRGTRY